MVTGAIPRAIRYYARVSLDMRVKLMQNQPVIFPAPAKINLHLHVTGLLDDGRHMLDTSFAFVDLCDELHIEAAKTLEVSCSERELNGKDNLVYTVLQALQQHYHVTQGIRVHIKKSIPEQAGLGGGSSDAATALLAANRLWQLNIHAHELIQWAAAYGADIPCFLFQQASHAKGVGEQLEAYQQKLPAPFVCLARPDGGLSTAKVFRAWDALTTPQGVARVRAASGGSDLLGSNDLEFAAIRLMPELGTLLSAMREDGYQAWMSGSGSCCVALCNSVDEAEQLGSRLKDLGVAQWCYACRLLPEHPLKMRFIDSSSPEPMKQQSGQR